MTKLRRLDWALMIAVTAFLFLLTSRTQDRFTRTDAQMLVTAKDRQAALRDEQLGLLWSALCKEHPLSEGCGRNWKVEILTAGAVEDPRAGGSGDH